MTELSPERFSILVLAGGRGQRMGGADKGLLPWRGRPLIAQLFETLRPLTDDLIISCNRNIETYRLYADRCVTDTTPDYPGPLAGICAGLDAARHDWLVALPCDGPQVGMPMIHALAARAQAESVPVMLRCDGRWEPLYCAIPLACRSDIEQAWASGIRSPREALLQLGARALDVSGEDRMLLNLNTPQQLHDAASWELSAGNPHPK